ncbi:hypothetical protein BC832DRAFT_536463 [Gaertneriomyces semiglobifer]|nr:hypothetical protein BC832DRAFT_536463 [Gaertneriomyces semiglobifer]
MSLPVEAERLDLFTKVVHTVFKRWTALQLAIANANFPSGHRTQELAEHTLEFFSQHKTEVYPDEIAENLKDFFDEIFDVELEDGSPEQIGKSLVRMYREVVIDGNLEEARKLVQSAVATSSLAHSKVEKDDDSGCTKATPRTSRRRRRV